MFCASICATPGLGFDSCCLQAGAAHPLTLSRDTTDNYVDKLIDMLYSVWIMPKKNNQNKFNIKITAYYNSYYKTKYNLKILNNIKIPYVMIGIINKTKFQNQIKFKRYIFSDDWKTLAEDREVWRAYVHAVMNLRVR